MTVTNRKWLIVGGANVDVKAVSSNNLLLYTSNPGTVITTAGGVARNIAENLARLGEEVHLFGLVGEDGDGEWLHRVTVESGVHTHGMVCVPGQRTGRYVSIHDESGEMLMAVSDMTINEAWNDQHVSDIVKGLQAEPKPSGMFLDANLPLPVIQSLLGEAKKQGVSVILDPVSVKKARVFRGILEGIRFIAPSQEEASVLTDISIYNKLHVEQVAQALLAQGVQSVIITCGVDGIYLRNETESGWLTPLQVLVRDVTGAGDAFTAGAMFGLARTDSLREQGTYGLCMAEAALRSEHSVAQTISMTELIQAKEAYERET